MNELEFPAHIDTLKLHKLAMAQSISTASGVLFSADQRFRNHLRLNVGHPIDGRVEAALKTLGSLAKCTGVQRDG